MHQQALALLRSTSQVDSTGKIENGKKTGRRRENIVGVQKWIAIWICESFKLKGHDASKYHQIWLIECGQKKKICATECGKKKCVNECKLIWNSNRGPEGLCRKILESPNYEIPRKLEKSGNFPMPLSTPIYVQRNLLACVSTMCFFFFWCAGRF